MLRYTNTIFTAVFLFVGIQLLSSQQEYLLKHYGGPGTIYLYNRATGLLDIPGIIQAGTNVSWDMNAFTELNTHPGTIVTPSQAFDQITFLTFCSLSGIPAFDCFNIWSQTEQALLLQDSVNLLGLSLVDLKRFQNKTSNLLLENFFGFTVDFQGSPTPAVIVYQKPDTIFTFPLSYGAEWECNIRWTFDLSITGENLVFRSIQNRTSSVDAWGTVYTPYDTFTNVVRVRSEIVHTDTLFTDTLDIPLSIKQVEYMWFDTSYKLPVMIALGLVTDSFEVINSLEYIYEATCAQPTWSVETDSDLYYLDSTGTVTVHFDVIDSNADEYTWDFGDGLTETSTGSISHTYDLPGDYAVAVTGCMTNCLPLNSCQSDIIDFVIEDTITSVQVIPGDLLGIDLYPNPVNKELTLKIPEQLGTQQYIISDITGRQIDKGILSPGISNLQTGAWGNGFYTIRFWNSSVKNTQLAVMRFVVVK